MDKKSGFFDFGEDEDVVVYCGAANGIVIVDFLLNILVDNVNYKVDFFLLEIVKEIGRFGFVDFIESGEGDVVLSEEIGCFFGSVDGEVKFG